MKGLCIVGSTGSIGRQTLQVAQARGYAVTALCAGRDAAQLYAQACTHKPQFVALHDPDAAAVLAQKLQGSGIVVLSGAEGVCRAVRESAGELVLNAAVGIAGLRPSIAALEAGKTLALANKESLVCAGEMVMELARARGLAILPVDSEHGAIFQCMQAGRRDEVERVILTASGGPFFGKTRAELQGVTAEQALKHPNWSMGSKITIDSATMMNKAFEVIEAKYLFALQPEEIEVVVHRQSIVHSMVQFRDGSLLAQLSPPDMRHPIQYALDYPQRCDSAMERLDFSKSLSLDFAPPDRETFPALSLAWELFARGGNYGAAINGANEQCVALFLQGKIDFLAIATLVAQAAQHVPFVAQPTLADIFETDRAARAWVTQQIR